MRDSRQIHAMHDPKVIIAGAGMSSGGRIRAHEKRYLPEKNATVLLVGYQAPGSLGRRKLMMETKPIFLMATIDSGLIAPEHATVVSI